ncbi:MAG TPA: papain-like cysteine protease family protein [Methylomirabilota bacterium]|jgi:hypothetical protein|nr:papain-like cysteine protease family protein [Methylomirabilota bacterium]
MSGWVRRWSGVIIAVVAAGCSTTTTTVVPAACAPGPSATLPVTSHAQETGMWCWAASGQMVMHYLGNNVPQCTQANNRFNRNDCPCAQCGPNAQPNPPCVIGGWPEFDRYGFDHRRTNDTPLTWDQLTRELSRQSGCGRRPVAFSWAWTGGGGHMMVMTGFASLGGVNHVTIVDPWAPCLGDSRIVPYDAFVSGNGYTHWDDFYEIIKR